MTDHDSKKCMQLFCEECRPGIEGWRLTWEQEAALASARYAKHYCRVTTVDFVKKLINSKCTIITKLRS